MDPTALLRGRGASFPNLFTRLPRRSQGVEKPAGRRECPLRCLRTPRNSPGLGAGWRSAPTCAGRLGPLYPKASSRLRFCPAAINSASAFTFSSRLSLNLLKPCQSLASPNRGSTHTARFLMALR
jgi:hypothetical protein